MEDQQSCNCEQLLENHISSLLLDQLVLISSIPANKIYRCSKCNSYLMYSDCNGWENLGVNGLGEVEVTT
jgi:hypothetical protein